MSDTNTVDEQYRIIIPERIREKRAIKPGQKVQLIEKEDGALVLEVGEDVMDLFGILDCDGIHMTIEEINESIAKGAAGI